MFVPQISECDSGCSLKANKPTTHTPSTIDVCVCVSATTAHCVGAIHPAGWCVCGGGGGGGC